MKGRIRVLCRVRPLLPFDPGFASNEVSLSHPPNDPDARTIVATGPPTASVDGRRSHRRSWGFEFDRVFPSRATQADIFEELAPVVQSAMDGYRVCVFAYGQTGSGKTHTMEGTPSDPGLIPTTIAHVIDTIEDVKKRGWTYKLDITHIEIYNESLRDLLAPSGRKAPVVSARARHRRTLTQV